MPFCIFSKREILSKSSSSFVPLILIPFICTVKLTSPLYTFSSTTTAKSKMSPNSKQNSSAVTLNSNAENVFVFLLNKSLKCLPLPIGVILSNRTPKSPKTGTALPLPKGSRLLIDEAKSTVNAAGLSLQSMCNTGATYSVLKA